MSRYLASASSNSGSNSGSLSADGQCQYSDNIQSLLPELRDKELQEISLRIMEKPLRGIPGYLASCYKNSHGLIGKHDYMILQYEGDQWIKAEKVGDSRKGQADAGIHISLVELDGPGDGSGVRHEVSTGRLGRGRMRWTLGPLLDILTKHNPDYDLMAENCWKYAFSSAKAILKWCQENAVDGDMRLRLARELDEIKHVERPMPRDVVDMVIHPFRPESRETRQLLKQKWAHTVAHLPEDSLRRQTLSFLHKQV